MSALHSAIYDMDVQADVVRATTLDVLPASDDPRVGPTTITRPITPGDYVAAIRPRAERFGLTAGDVTESAVAALLGEQAVDVGAS
jgi:hypothetical protein